MRDKKFYIGALAYIMLYLGVCFAVLGVLNLIAIHALNDVFYVLGGMAIVASVMSWLLFNLSRKK